MSPPRILGCDDDAHAFVGVPGQAAWKCRLCGVVDPHFSVKEAEEEAGSVAVPVEVHQAVAASGYHDVVRPRVTPRDVVHDYKMAQLRDQCEHDLVFEDGMCAGCSRIVLGDELGAVCILTPAQVDQVESDLADGTLVERRTVRDLLLTLRAAWRRVAELEAAEL